MIYAMRYRYLIIITALTGVLVGCSSGPEPTTNPVAAADSTATPATLLAKGQAGEVRVGMPIADLAKQYGNRFRAIAPESGAAPDSTYELADSSGKPLLRVTGDCKPTCEVARIDILSPTYLTENGIGVGSQLSEIRAVYQLSDISFQPEKGLSARIVELGARIVFDVSMLDQATLETTDPAKLPADLLVERIVLE